MPTPDNPKIDKITADAERSDEEEEEISHIIEASDEAQASGSTSNKKKKKKSKAKKILDALSPKNAVTQAVLEKVVEKVKEDGAPGSENIDAEDVRQVLQQIKIMDVLKGKTGIGGNNRKDTGEHKVRSLYCWENQSPYIVFSSGVHNQCPNWVWTSSP
jgi:glycylpeptide N-tetradecanoyltransferase